MATAIELLKAGSTLSGTNTTWEYLNNLGGGGGTGQILENLKGTVISDNIKKGIVISDNIQGKATTDGLIGVLAVKTLKGTIKETDIKGIVYD